MTLCYSWPLYQHDLQIASSFLSMLTRASRIRRLISVVRLRQGRRSPRPQPKPALMDFGCSHRADCSPSLLNYMDYYSFTDPGGMEGWVGLTDWPIADTLPTWWSPVNRQGSDSLPAKTDIRSVVVIIIFVSAAVAWIPRIAIVEKQVCCWAVNFRFYWLLILYRVHIATKKAKSYN